MGRLTAFLTNWGGGQSTEAGLTALKVAMGQIFSEFNGKIDFVANIRSAGPFTVVLPASTITKVPHNFTGVPSGYLITKQVGTGVVSAPVQGQYSWNDNFIYLTATSATTVTFYLI